MEEKNKCAQLGKLFLCHPGIANKHFLNLIFNWSITGQVQEKPVIDYLDYLEMQQIETNQGKEQKCYSKSDEAHGTSTRI